jgi:hypothetical protein
MERTLSTAAAAWLETHRPAAAAETHAILAEHDVAAKEKPLSVVRFTSSSGNHPKIREYELELRTEYLPDDDSPAGTAADAHAALVDLFAAEFQSLRHDLAQEALLLRKLVPGATTDEPLDERARVLVHTWSAIIQSAL